MMTPITSAAPVTFILSADPEKLRPFYTDTLGLNETGQNAYAISYDLGGIAMRLTHVPGYVPHAHTVLGWAVADIDAAVDALAARGVEFAIYDGFGQDARGIWTDSDSGTRLAWFNDPEGNNLSIAQFAD